MITRVIGIDPSLNNSGVALVQDDLNNPGQILFRTAHINRLEPGTYSQVIRRLVDPNNQFGLVENPFQNVGPYVTCGFVEDFSNIGGGNTNKTAIKAVSHSGGMAEEAIVAAGIPMYPIAVGQWRKLALGKPPQTLTKTGRLRPYWTKGNKKFHVPDNVTPKLLNLIGHQMGLHHRANAYDKLVPSGIEIDLDYFEFESAVKWIAENGVTSRRLQIVFGISLDELEAAAIALAGYTLIKQGQIEGL